MAGAPAKPKRKAARKPARPEGLAHGRWLGDFDPPPSKAERELIDYCGRGEEWTPDHWDGERPEEATAANSIRGEIVRFLALGGDALHPVHEEGVVVRGAWISSTLDLHQCHAAVRLSLKKCYFEDPPCLMQAQLPELVLSGSLVPGLEADRLTMNGGIYLRDGFTTQGEVRLPGAQIDGNLDCIGGKFSNAKGPALFADGIMVKGDVNLRNDFAAQGEVRLPGAQIGGNLDCSGGKFTNAKGHALSADGIMVKGTIFLSADFAARGEVRLLNADIGGSLDCSGGRFTEAEGDALNAEGMTVKGRLFFRDAKIAGAVSLAPAHIGTLIDDNAQCWNAGGHMLDGLHYDRIVGSTDASTRIGWLKRQRPDQLNSEDWAPQPWEQLIKVLREMGHPREAAEVAMEKQRMMRAAGRVGGPLAVAWHQVYEELAGFGYRPSRIIKWMAAVWLFCSVWYWQAADGFAVFGPTSAEITSATLYPEAAQICGHGNEQAKQRWTECSAMPDEYTTFEPFLYSLDLILPLVDLQQESDWAPIAEGPTGKDLIAGVVTRFFMWFEILFGWFASLMFAAIVSRLVEKD